MIYIRPFSAAFILRSAHAKRIASPSGHQRPHQFTSLAADIASLLLRSPVIGASKKYKVGRPFIKAKMGHNVLATFVVFCEQAMKF
jgi:hypothetical protein